MNRTVFAAGMTDLSGVYDVGADRHMTDEQSMARINGYYRALKHVPDDVWREAVDLMFARRKTVVKADGQRVPPGFPALDECLEFCRLVAEQHQPKLVPPQLTPAPPEVAAQYIAHIKWIARHGRGPLTGDLDDAADPGDWGRLTEASRARRAQQHQGKER